MQIGSITLLGIAVLIIAAIGLIAIGFRSTFANGSVIRDRIKTYAVLPGASGQSAMFRSRSKLSELRFQLNTMLSALNSEKIALDLLRANWQVTVTEFLLIRTGVTVAGFLLAWLVSGSSIPGIGLAIITYLAPGIYLRRRINRRQVDFERQLLDVLVLITGAVRAGFSLLQALELIDQEMKPPASEEFRRVIHEASLGLSVPQALQNLSARMENDDLNLVVTAVEIQYQVGGNLATMLNAVSETIRERIRLFGEIRVVTTQQRYTGYLLSILPFIIGGLLFIMNPEYMSRLFQPGPLICIPIGAIAGIIMGHFVIQRITKVTI
jgi:tight adherence protein B